MGMPYFSETALAARAGPEGCEQEIDLVVGDHAFRRLHRARRVGRIIGVDDLDGISLAAGLDPALGIDSLDPQVVTALLLEPFGRQWTGQRQRRADLDRVLCGRRKKGQYSDAGGGDAGCDPVREIAGKHWGSRQTFALQVGVDRSSTCVAPS